MLEIINLHSGYNRIEVLHDINITVPDGKIISVIGRNGAGKSTLLNTISGIVKIRSGSILLYGKKIPSAPHSVVATGIIQVPEGRRIFPSLSINENLIMGGYLASAAEIAIRKEEVFQIFPILKERINQQAGTLSGGEQQMLAMGRALMGNPKLLLLDEPSMGLSPIITREIFSLIRLINKEKGISMILVEQNAHMALEHSERTYVLENGRVTMQGPSKEIKSNVRIIEAYLGV